MVGLGEKNKIKSVRLGDLVKISKGKKYQQVEKSSLRYLQIEDLRNDHNLKYCLLKEKQVLCQPNDILIAWDGANAGTIGYGLQGAIGSTLAKLEINSNRVHTAYLGRFLQSKYRYLRDNCTGATIPHISKGILTSLEIPLPDLSTQKHIAQILDDAAALRDKTKQLIVEYDQLEQSIFLDMFGDPVVNPKKFNTGSLLNHGNFKNGLNFSKKETGVEVKYLGVGDFKSKYKLDDIEELSSINLSNLPSDDYFLKDGDLVFVRSNGNKELVGRCLSIYPVDKRVAFSGFCIRYRLNDNDLNSIFLTHLFRIKSFKKSMLKGGRGVNIQNINQKILSELGVIIPPIKLQNQFAEKITLIEKQKALAKQELKEAEDLFNCLLQKAFKGELV